jgi:hypothetical protein
MRHRQFVLRLGAAFNTHTTLQADQIGNSNTLSLDVLPEFGVKCTSFQLDDIVSVSFEILTNGIGSDCTDGNLPKEAGVGLQRESWRHLFPGMAASFEWRAPTDPSVIESGRRSQASP